MISLFNSTSGQKNTGVLGPIGMIPQLFSALPVKPTSILSQAKGYLGMRDEELKIGIFLDPRMTDNTIEHLVNMFEPTTKKTRVMVHILTEGMTLSDKVSYDAMVFALSTPDTAGAMISQASSKEIPCLVMVEQGLRAEAAEVFGLSILDVASSRKLDLMVSQTATWFAQNLGGHRMSLAADFLFMRPALAKETIEATARQNLVIATVFFMPGADMPVMTLNQIKMTLQLAFIYGEEFTLKRIVECVGVVFTAFAWRFAARMATRALPRVFRIPAKIGIAYATTIALGKAMELQLLHAPDMPALDKPMPTDVREILEKTPLAKVLPKPKTQKYLPAP